MKKKTLLVLSSMVLGAQSIFSAPTIYPTESSFNQLSTVKNHTTSNLMIDNVIGTKVYVMPPNSAKAMVSKDLFLRTSNLGFCREMGDLQGYSRRVSADIADYEKRIEGKKREYDLALGRLVEAKELAAQFATEKNLTELESLDLRTAELDLLIKEKTLALKVCEKDCFLLEDEINDHREESQKVTNRRRELARVHTKNMREYEKHKKSVEGFEENLRLVTKSWNQMEDDLVSIKSTLFKIYKDLGSLEGARAAICYISNWDQNMDTLRRDNPGFEFEKVATQNAVFMTDIADVSSMPTASAVLSYQLSSCRNNTSGKCETSTYPESISGVVVLSTVGACPIEHPEYFDLNPNTPNSPNEMSFGMTVAYEYPTAMTVKAQARYNMYKMYQKIAKSGSGGGFFSRKSWSSIEEKTFFRDSFTVDWTEQDKQVVLPETRKLEIEREMRNNVFARLAKIGLPAVQSPVDLISPTVPPSGAMILGEELSRNQACRGNIYCTGAAIGMKVLDAIFGSSSASASYTNIQDVDMKDEWSTTSVVYKPYITSYIKKK